MFIADNINLHRVPQVAEALIHSKSINRTQLSQCTSDIVTKLSHLQAFVSEDNILRKEVVVLVHLYCQQLNTLCCASSTVPLQIVDINPCKPMFYWVGFQLWRQ